MPGARLQLLCHACRTRSVREGCPACADLRETWAALGTSHLGREVPKPATVEVGGHGTVFTHRDDRGRWIAILVVSLLVMLQLALVLLLTRRPEDLYVVFAILGAVCLLGVFVSVRGLVRRRVIRLVDGVLSFGEGSNAAAIPASSIGQLVVHANHSAYSHESHLRWFSSCKLLVRTHQGDVLLVKGSFEEVRFLESQLEEKLWIRDDPRQNVLTTSG